MTKSKNSESNSALTFLTIVMCILLFTGIAFGVMAVRNGDGLFAIASASCFISLLFGCIRILE